MRALLAATLLMTLGACTTTGGPSFLRRAPAPANAWAAAHARAQELALAGQFTEADRTLADFATQHGRTPYAAEALYWRAVIELDPANPRTDLDSVLVRVETYLGSAPRPPHYLEALALRRLVRTAQQLARVEFALHQERVEDRDRPRAEAPPRAAGRDEESVREIQRLREELSKANAELERIRKRLAAPKP